MVKNLTGKGCINIGSPWNTDLWLNEKTIISKAHLNFLQKMLLKINENNKKLKGYLLLVCFLYQKGGGGKSVDLSKTGLGGNQDIRRHLKNVLKFR